MSKPLDQILDRRRQRQGAREQRRTTVVSLLFHTLIVVAVWLVPDLLAKPPEPFKYVAVTVVPPSVLGQEEVPPPPPPPPPDLPPPVDTPPPPDPEPEPEAPVLVKETKQAQPKPQPRQAPPAPPPPVRKPPPKRQGSPFGKSLGASHRNTTVGVEDPNFTYGFYLDRVVALISQHWKRPLEDPDVVQAAFYFRIRDDGSLSELRLVTSSGSQTFDGAAEQAVRAAPPFPPLPKQYTKKFGRDYLGINLIIK